MILQKMHDAAIVAQLLSSNAVARGLVRYAGRVAWGELSISPAVKSRGEHEVEQPICC